MSDSLVVKPGAIVVVSGANGNIASHIVDQLLAFGYRVRGTVRNKEKNAWLISQFGAKYGTDKIELCEVPDMATPGAFDEAVKGASGFIHTATSVMESADPKVAVPMAIDGTLNVLISAAKEPGMKRVVITSSSGAATAPKPNVKFHIDENTWNEEAVKAAWAPPKEPYNEIERRVDVYFASKTQSEQAAWAFVKEHKPPFVLNSVLPNCNFGPIINSEHQSYHSTLGWLKACWEGFEGQEEVKLMDPQYHINIIDDAQVHVAALIYEDVKGERLFAFEKPFNWNSVLAIMRKLAPKREFVSDLEGLGQDMSTVSNERAEELLKRLTGHGWSNLETSVKQAIAGFP